MSESFTIETRLSARQAYSTPVPELIVKGGKPIVVITFPLAADSDPDVMTVDVDATGFDVGQLSAMLHALAHSLDEGKKLAEATGTVGTDVDWEALKAGADLGENEPDGASK